MTRRPLLTLVLLAFGLSFWTNAAAQTPATVALLDLPAAILTPADAESVGLSGYGRYGNGNRRELDEYAQGRADFQQKPVDEVIATLTESGWLQGYSSDLLLPDQPGSQNAQPTQVLFSSLYQFATPEGASSALAYITDYSGVTGATVDTSIDGPAIGDESVWVRTTSATLHEQGPSDEVAVVYRIGDLIAAVGAIDYTVSATDVATPTATDPARVETVATLASLVGDHLEAIESAPGLSHLVTRLGTQGERPTIPGEGYRRLDGLDIPYFNDGFTDDFPGAAAASTNAYEYTAALGTGGNPYDPYFALRVIEFPDDASASAYIAQSVAELGPAASPTAGESPLGDESALIPESWEPAPGVTVAGYISLVRVGNLVSWILYESAANPPGINAVLALSAAHTQCLQTGACPAIPIPTT